MKRIWNTALGALTASFIWGNVAFAADTSAANAPKSDAVKKLESVLQKAGEQGFVAIQGQAKNPSINISNDEKFNEPIVESFGAINCSVASALDLSIYKSVSSYDAISHVKSGLEKLETIEAVMPLVKTYMALGLGTEVASSVRKFKGHKAELIESIGHAIAGYPLDRDLDIIAQYSNCNADMKLWSLFAKASRTSTITDNETVELSRENQEFLEELPPELKKLMNLRLGIYAAEQQSEALAVRILSSLEPDTKYGKPPTAKDDAILYYYGLVRQMKGDPRASEIFKHLAKSDGLYRTRSLHKLAKKSFKDGTKLYDNFSDDIAAVNQQYHGQAESRQATLQVVKHSLQTDQIIAAIEQSKREFALIDKERMEAVVFAAQHILLRLKDELNSQQLNALNAYLHDPLFFSKYENIDELKSRAKDTANNLNLPELVSIIEPEEKKLSKDQKSFLTYTNALIAAKQGDLDRVLDVEKQYKSDPKFQKLILDAALQSGNYEETIASLRHKEANAERFMMQSDIAWQKGHWGEAKIALEALAHKSPDKEIAKKIAITNYVGTESRAYIGRAVPSSAVELDRLKTQLDNDIKLVKGYLADG